MKRSFDLWSLRWTILVITISMLQIEAMPVLDLGALLDPARAVCTSETMALCQRCAKTTKSVIVYPWCCANHDGVYDWCQHYMYFGL